MMACLFCYRWRKLCWEIFGSPDRWPEKPAHECPIHGTAR